MRLGLLLLLLLSTSLPAWAGPLHIQAKRLEVLHGKQQAIFNGDVLLTRDDFQLRCDRLVAFYREKGGELERAEAFGHVRLQQGSKHGTSERAILDQRANTLTMIGNAVLVQPGGRIRGETIVHDLHERRTEVRPSKGGRVELHLESEQGLSGGGSP